MVAKSRHLLEPARCNLNVIVSNARGLGSNSAINIVNGLIRRPHTDLIILTDTMLSEDKLNNQALCINLNSFKAINARGLSKHQSALEFH